MMWRTGTGSVVDCRVWEGLVLDLKRAVYYTENWYWDFSGLKRIWRSVTRFVVDGRV